MTEQVKKAPDTIEEILSTPGLEGVKATITGIARGIAEDYIQTNANNALKVYQYTGFLQQGGNFLKFIGERGAHYRTRTPRRDIVSMLKTSSEADTEITLSGDLFGKEGSYHLQVRGVTLKGYIEK